MPRSPVSGYHDDDAEDEEEAGSKSGRVDATMLPPG